MNEKPTNVLIAALAMMAATTTITTAVLLNEDQPTKEVPVPGPTVTEKEVREHKIPVPGPTVTKKVVETKTVRPKAPEKATRSNERKWKAPKAQAPAVPTGSARDIARSIFGSEFSCADALITKESGWRVNATNPSSGAYGLPQALPGPKMASAGSDWRTNPATQLKWMKGYVDSRYGGICGAWNHSQRNNWY